MPLNVLSARSMELAAVPYCILHNANGPEHAIFNPSAINNLSIWLSRHKCRLASVTPHYPADNASHLLSMDNLTANH